MGAEQPRVAKQLTAFATPTYQVCAAIDPAKLSLPRS